MNAGIVTSFLIGGLLLLSILQMNFTVNSNAAQTTLQIVTKNNMQAITTTLTSDLGRMGHNVDSGVQVVDNSSNSEKITFQADIDGTVRTITWEFKDDTEFSESANPNDYQLVRTGPVSTGNVQTTVYAAVHFNVTYFDADGNTTGDMGEVKQINIELLSESPEAIGQNSSSDSDVYGRSFWQKTIVPPSMQFRGNN